jgi:hypothetical protein
MRPIKRLLLFASELGVLVFGVGFSFAVVVADLFSVLASARLALPTPEHRVRSIMAN